MRVLSKRTLRKFWEAHTESEQQLITWYKDFKKAEYKSTDQVLESFANCRSIGSNRYIFKIKGNRYRLVVKMNFDLQTVWIRFIGTHSEYDKINALTI